jgi:hypothetical protein
MTRIVPDRAGIGVFRLIGMGLGWPRDQMAGSVRQWRRHEYTHSVASHRDRAIDIRRGDGDKSRNRYISIAQAESSVVPASTGVRNNTGSLLIIGHASKALPEVPASFDYSSSSTYPHLTPPPSLSSRHQPLHPIINNNHRLVQRFHRQRPRHTKHNQIHISKPQSLPCIKRYPPSQTSLPQLKTITHTSLTTQWHAKLTQNQK